MEKLVPVLNQLQSVLGILGAHSISLPQLVVVGSQSSGKSSVLENIVGRDFLPRGTNIVTRRPLILQLLNTAAGLPDGASTSTQPAPNAGSGGSGNSSKSEWGEFEHVQGRFYDFAAIKAEIERETERLTGKGTAISSVPIFLRVFSPSVPNLTLVDLPGITKVATGDQPADIERQIREMVLAFISNPNSIIVAVSPATEDIANSEALKIAREVDPKCARTVGVLTKLDLMDPGTDAKRVLMNQAIPLQLGYVGVVNRGQRDITDGKPIHAALADERAYFERSVYSSMAARMGTQYLTKRLTALLLSHLQTYLPVIRQQILGTIQETERELEGYGDPLSLEGLFQATGGGIAENDALANGLPRTPEEQQQLRARLMGPLMLDLLSKFAAHYIEALDGRSNDIYAAGTDAPQLIGGARIAFVFNDIFGAHLDGIQPFDYLGDADIRMAIRNATGPRPTLFLPEMAFDLLVKKQIERLRSPAIECVDMVFEELQRVASQCESSAMPQLARFPHLRDALLQCVKRLLASRVAPTKATVNSLVNIELAYINTNHPDFIGGSRALNQLAQQRKARAAAGGASAGGSGGGSGGTAGSPNAGAAGLLGPDGKDAGKDKDGGSGGGALGSGSEFTLKPPSDRESIETDVIKLLISSYFDIVKKTVKDTVPKSIMLFLVNKTKQEIQSELVRHLYKEDQFPLLLQEADDVAEKRQSCVKLIRLMRKALEVVSQINDAQL